MTRSRNTEGHCSPKGTPSEAVGWLSGRFRNDRISCPSNLTGERASAAENKFNPDTRCQLKTLSITFAVRNRCGDWRLREWRMPIHEIEKPSSCSIKRKFRVGFAAAAMMLVAYGAPVALTVETYQPALKTNEGVVNRLLEKDAESERPSIAPLLAAAWGGHEVDVNGLLEKGTNPNVEIFGVTPLLAAAWDGHEAVVELLLKYGAEAEHPSVAPLLVAAWANSKDIPQRLETTRPSVAVFGVTPLYAAASNGHEAVVSRLLENGASPNAKSLGVTPLHAAALNGHEAVVSLLLKYSADVNAKSLSRSGFMPLHAAALNGHEAIVQQLLDAGADPVAKDNIGFAPLQQAQLGGHKSIAKLLIAASAK